MDWITTSTILSGLKDFERGEVWSRFVDRFRRPIVGFVRDLGLTVAEAEDVAQETLLAFADGYRRGAYDPARGRLSQWLFGIAYRQALRQRRRNVRREGPIGAEGEATDFWNRLPDPDHATEVWDRRWEDAMLQTCLQRVRDEVEPATFEAFELSVRDDRPAADVAAALQIPVKAVYNAKHRVLSRIRALREQLETVQ